jgi:hypothetical protein
VASGSRLAKAFAMKLPFELKRDLITRGSVLLIAGFAIFVLVENGCSGTVAQSNATDAGVDAGDAGCFAGETPTTIGSLLMCCSGTAPNLVCNGGGRVGDSCNPTGYFSQQLTVNATLDVCVSDDCNGDHNPTTYDSKIVVVAAPLNCTDGKLVSAGDPTTQEVDRVCAQTAELACSSGYGYGYGYGYYGASNAVTRSVSVSSSVCSTSNSAPTPCDVGVY